MPPRSGEPGRPLFGILGMGRFGRLAGEVLGSHGDVWGHDPTPGAAPPGVRLVTFEEACSARVVILAVPIRAMEAVLGRMAPHLRRPALVVDTASVKTLPCGWMEQKLPQWADLLGTHPLFGPDSAGDGVRGLKIAFCPLRLRHTRTARRFLESLGLRVVPTRPDVHDRDMAHTQAVVQFLGRALERLEAKPEDLDTSGYRKLLEILRYVRRDTWELFLDMQRYNPHAEEARGRLLRTLGAINEEILSKDD
jgi:prephenate dehydrogenase